MILVVGATGMLGGIITQQLLAQGKDVRILARHNSPSEALAAQGMATSVQTLIDAGAQPVHGDLKDRASLDRAVDGVDTVVTTANSAFRDGEDTVETVDLQGNLNLIAAAQTAGARRFIYTSVLGADTNSPIPLVRCKAEAEAILRESGMTYTVLAPNLIAEVWVGVVVGALLQAGQPVTLVGEARTKHSMVSIGDVAAFAVAAVDNPAAANATLPIGGPEGLSWREVVAMAGDVVGQELPVRFVQSGEPVPFVPGPVQQSMAIQDTYDSILPMNELAATYGVTLTPMTTVLQRMFGRS
jgi:NADH dehydrogenase